MGRPSRIAQQRQELVPKLARAFADLGYRRATTTELARRCGLQETILYRHWAGKQAMFIAAIEYVYALSAATWARLVAGGDGGRGAARRILEYEAAHHGEFGLYRIVFAGLSEADDPEIRTALQRMYGKFHGFVCQEIRAHRRKRKDLRLPAAEISAWAIVGLGTVASICRELGLLGERRRRALIEQLGRLILEGSGQPPSPR